MTSVVVACGQGDEVGCVDNSVHGMCVCSHRCYEHGMKSLLKCSLEGPIEGAAHCMVHCGVCV